MATVQQLVTRSMRIRKLMGCRHPPWKVNAWAIMLKPGHRFPVYMRRQRELVKIDQELERELMRMIRVNDSTAEH